MSTTATIVIAVVSGSVPAAVVSWFASRRQQVVDVKRVSVEAGSVQVSSDEHQQARITHLESRVDRFERLRENDLDYIGHLKHHIWSKKGPPPPDRPPMPPAARTA